MNVKNVKLSIQIEELALDNATDLLSAKKIEVKKYPNFISFKQTFTYVLFKSSGKKLNHVNATKISSVEKITDCLQELFNLLNRTIVSYKVDNIISTSKLAKPVNLKKVIEKNIFKRITYNSERFPGMFIRFEKGTSIVFHSGNIVIVGCKTESEIEAISKCLTAHI